MDGSGTEGPGREARLRPIADIFSLNTDLLANCVRGVTEAHANHRLEGGGKSIAFLVAHLTDARSIDEKSRTCRRWTRWSKPGPR